jgi:hypothetical protein
LLLPVLLFLLCEQARQRAGWVRQEERGDWKGMLGWVWVRLVMDMREGEMEREEEIWAVFHEYGDWIFEEWTMTWLGLVR